MKNICAKSGKGKIHPSPSSPSLSVLNLLPTAILALTSVLSVDDQEVLAYLILRSISTINPSSTSTSSSKKCKKPPTFDCGCFDCYTRFWIRWDSSPNRDLIHHAIDAFEDHLSHSELPKKTHKPRHKNRRLSPEKPRSDHPVSAPQPEISATEKNLIVPAPPPDDAAASAAAAAAAAAAAEEVSSTENASEDDEEREATGNRLQPVGTVQQQQQLLLGSSGHRGLARKVWPDVLGLFNSRLLSLWGPNV